MADLGRKWSKFRYHGNKGRPNENLNTTIKSAVPNNPLFGANSAPLAFVHAELNEWMNTYIYIAPVKQKSSEALAAE